MISTRPPLSYRAGNSVIIDEHRDLKPTLIHTDYDGHRRESTMYTRAEVARIIKFYRHSKRGVVRIK